MSQQDQTDVGIVLDEFVEEYLLERKNHFDNWVGYENGWGRITNNEKIFRSLRKEDFTLTKSFIKKLSEKNLSKEQLIEMKVFSRNHDSILNFRTVFITLIFTVITASYAFFDKAPKVQEGTDWQFVFLFVFFIIFGAAIFSERWNIKQKSSIYKEIENIIQCEIDKKS